MRELYSQAGFVIMLAVCAAAVARGGREVRRVAGVTAAGWTATLALQVYAGDVVPGRALVWLDGLIFLAFLWVARRRVRGWTVLLLTAQGLAMAVHLVRALTPSMSDWSYLTALAAAGYLVLTAVAWGTWATRTPGQA